ncbi:MAG TPA: hypothetical protein VIW68_05290 [Candidatus Sulfotelmatobacter sp.]
MWIFTRYGFYSIACASKPDGSLDPQFIMVRARCKAHLTGLQERFPKLGGEILESPKRDYRFRLILSKVSWIAIVSELAKEQEWSNFKAEVAKYQGARGGQYVGALHDVWGVMYELQQDQDRQ